MGEGYQDGLSVGEGYQDGLSVGRYRVSGLARVDNVRVRVFMAGCLVGTSRFQWWFTVRERVLDFIGDRSISEGSHGV